jgi:hypothetical protein
MQKIKSNCSDRAREMDSTQWFGMNILVAEVEHPLMSWYFQTFWGTAINVAVQFVIPRGREEGLLKLRPLACKCHFSRWHSNSVGLVLRKSTSWQYFVWKLNRMHWIDWRHEAYHWIIETADDWKEYNYPSNMLYGPIGLWVFEDMTLYRKTADRFPWENQP